MFLGNMQLKVINEVLLLPFNLSIVFFFTSIQQSLHQLIIPTNHWHSGCFKARPVSPLLNTGRTLMCHRILRTRRCLSQKACPSSLIMQDILKGDDRCSLVSKRNKIIFCQKSLFSKSSVVDDFSAVLVKRCFYAATLPSTSSPSLPFRVTLHFRVCIRSSVTTVKRIVSNPCEVSISSTRCDFAITQSKFF